MYWEYTGTGWITHLGQEDPIADSRAQYDAVAAKDLEEHGIRWLEPAPFENTYALAVREEAVDDLGVRTLSELPGLLESDRGAATLCLGSEFSTRPDGLPGLESHYGFKLPPRNLTLVQDAVVYTQVDKGNPCNFGVVFTTDGRVDALGLFVLDDDKSFFPKFNPSLNVRETVYQSHPELGKLAAELASALDEDTMTRLNAEVDVDGNEPEDVARRWLRQADLIG
jgi:osmoprotectant transport system substrate-binding protein